VRLRERGWLGGGVLVEIPEQPGGYPDRADPVDHRVVHATDQRRTPPGQREGIEAPERPGVVEALGEQIPDRLT
jgi:hypothetical protein